MKITIYEECCAGVVKETSVATQSLTSAVISDVNRDLRCPMLIDRFLLNSQF